MCAVAQNSSEHQGSSELPRIPILGTSVNSDRLRFVSTYPRALLLK
jgi:hypothetical protein